MIKRKIKIKNLSTWTKLGVDISYNNMMM